MKTSVILTAGGIGSRLNNNIPKQFLTVNEIPIIIYTLQQFQNDDNISQIIVACTKDWQPMLRAYGYEFNISKLTKIVDGGATGIDSIRNCFVEIDNDNEDSIILIHDGNRPLVNSDIIKRNIEADAENGASSTYVDIHDGIVRVDENLIIQKSDIVRSKVKSTQTPHTFKYSVLKDVFDKITDSEQYISLADAAVRQGCNVELVKGSELNFKITTQNDLTIFESIINMRIRDV